MTKTDDLDVAIRMACDNTSRSDSEQKALLRLADAVDFERNQQTVTNHNTEQSYLYDYVQDTRYISIYPENKEHHVELPRRKGEVRTSESVSPDPLLATARSELSTSPMKPKGES